MKKINKGMAAVLALLLSIPAMGAAAPLESGEPLPLTSPSAILAEASTGTVIFEKNADEKREVASVTKLMTLLLLLEDLEAGRFHLEDQVTVSQTAAAMKGSQALLDAGAAYPLETLLRSTIIASANDAAVALAEYAEGSEADYTCIVPGSDAVARYSVVGTAQNISSRTVVIAENLEEPKTGEWYMDVYLLDTQTGQRQEITGYHEFGAEKEYDFGEAIWLSEPDGSSYSTGLFQVTFVSPQGDDWKDLYREDGTLLLDNLSGEWQYLGDWRSEDTAVLGAERNGVRGLWRLDGTCLYREDQGEQRFDLQLSSQSSDCGSDSARAKEESSMKDPAFRSNRMQCLFAILLPIRYHIKPSIAK